MRRSWLFSAARRNWFPDRTWRAQRRTKRTANAVRTRKPRIPIRNTVCGVRRYGAWARGSRGRKRPGRYVPARLANELDLRAGLRRMEEAPDERKHGEGEEQ